MSKMTVVVKASLACQVLLLLIGSSIVWITRNSDDFTGIIAAIPYAFYDILLLLNVAFVIMLIRRHSRFDTMLIILLAINIILLVFDNTIFALASGNSLVLSVPYLPL